MSKELRLFKDFWDDVPTFFNKNWGFPKVFTDEFDKIFNGKCDFEEFEDKYAIDLEVPGVEKNEINISLKDDDLKISWNRKKENKEGDKKNSRYKRREGSFTRSFTVKGADPDKINAELKNGVLKIVLPKFEEAKSKRIEIK
jgi:HSP20 family protein